MAHFARIDDGHIVGMVLVIPDAEIVDDNGNESDALGETYINEHLGMEGSWIQTSYNGRIRGVYAGVGFAYDRERDVFVPSGWTLIDGVWTPPEPQEPAA